MKKVRVLVEMAAHYFLAVFVPPAVAHTGTCSVGLPSTEAPKTGPAVPVQGFRVTRWEPGLSVALQPLPTPQ